MGEEGGRERVIERGREWGGEMNEKGNNKIEM